MFRIWLLVFVSLFFYEAQAGGNKEKRIRESLRELTWAEVQEDMAYAKSMIEKYHPGLYTYQNQTEWTLKWADMMDNIQNMNKSRMNVYSELSKTLANVKCVHTYASLSQDDLAVHYNIKRFSPLALYFFKDKAYTLHHYVDSLPFEVGTEIISVNGIPSDSLRIKLFEFLSHDGYNESGKYTDFEGGEFPLYYYYFIDRPDSFTYEYRVSDDSVASATLQAIDFYTIISHSYLLSDKFRIYPLIQTEFIDSLNTAILYVGSFDNNELKYEQSLFLEKIEWFFSTLRSKEIGNLILDLRWNAGGNLANSVKLYSYLTGQIFNYYEHYQLASLEEIPKSIKMTGRKDFRQFQLHAEKYFDNTYRVSAEGLFMQGNYNTSFNGNLFVLTNGGTLSAASELAAVLDYKERATLIGEETGGAYFGMNAVFFAFLELPNSRIIIQIPLMKVITPFYAHIQKGGGVKPSIPLHREPDETLGEFFKREQKFCLELISKEQKGKVSSPALLKKEP